MRLRRLLAVVGAAAAAWASPAAACSYVFSADPQMAASERIGAAIAAAADLPPACRGGADARCLLAIAGEPEIETNTYWRSSSATCSDPRVARFRQRVQLLFLAGRSEEARGWLERIPAAQRPYAHELSLPLIRTLLLARRGEDARWVARAFSQEAELRFARGRVRIDTPELLAQALQDRQTAWRAMTALRRLVRRSGLEPAIALMADAAGRGARFGRFQILFLLDRPSRLRLSLPDARTLARLAGAEAAGSENGAVYRAIYRIAVHNGDVELGDWAMGNLSLSERRYVHPDDGPLPGWDVVEPLIRLERAVDRAVAVGPSEGDYVVESVAELLRASAPFAWKLEWLEDAAVRLVEKGRSDLGLRLLGALPAPSPALDELIETLAQG